MAGQVMGGHPLQHHAGGLLAGDAIGHRRQLRRLDDGIFGITAGRHGKGHAVAGLYLGHIRAHGLDHTRPLTPQRERQLAGIGAHPVVDVDEVEANRLQPHQRLPGSRLGNRYLLQPQDLWPAEFMDANCLHGHEEPPCFREG
jgi:hypothetical protein